MLNTLALVLALAPARADSVQHYYSHADAEALRALCSHSDSREEDLLCRYRLYPLTMDEKYLKSIPARLDDGSAREKAILAGLWGYRASTGSIFTMMRAGRRASRLLSDAKDVAPEDPFVLLIEGQSLVFRPAVFGGDNHKALQIFRELQRVLEREVHDGITSMEADCWIWFTLDRMKDPAAASVKRSIEARNPPPLFADFLANPPS